MNALGCFDGTTGGDTGYKELYDHVIIGQFKRCLEAGSTYSLPERKKDHELNRDNFEKWAMLCKVASELDVELNETVHGDGYATSFYDHDLERSTGGLWAWGESKAYPHVSKSWADRFQTIPTNSLRDDCY